MASAIELYKRAYEADYRRGETDYAEELYREIVEKFPFSEEKEYSLIHLERIEKLKGNPNDPDYNPRRISSTGGSGALGAVSFALVLLVLAGCGFGGYTIWQQQIKIEYHDLLFKGMIFEKGNDYGNAALVYKEAQEMMPGMPQAYQISAEMYLKAKQFHLAEIEARRWAIADPLSTGVESFNQRLKKIASQHPSGGIK